MNHLIICGEAGSGKSETLENIIMPIFGTTTATSADQVSYFINAKMSTSSNFVPYIINEFKHSKPKNYKFDEISVLMRNAYDRTSAYRGRPDQMVNEYKPLAPIILSGEMSTDETAVLERSLEVLFSKTYLKDEVIQGRFKMLKHEKNY